MKIIITTSNYPWHNHPYSIQGYFLLKIFIELNHEIIYVSFNDKKFSPQLRSFSQVADMENSDDLNMVNGYIDKDNLELFKKAQYSGIKFDERLGNNVCSSHFNKLIDNHNVDLIFVMGDLTNFMLNEYFKCKSFIWFANYHEPLNKKLKEKLQIFDKILCMCPSSVNSLLPYFNQNNSISYAPNIIDSDYVTYLQNLIAPKLKKDIREEYNIPNNSKIISVIGANCERNMRKSFDTCCQVFKNLLLQHWNVFLYIQATTFKMDDFDNNLENIMSYLEIPSDKYIINTKPITILQMEELYKITDIILYANKSEGLGVSLLDAQIRGIPVVSNNFTIMKDYTFHGITCDPDQLYYDGYSGGMMSIPSVKNLTNGCLKVLSSLDKDEFDIAKLCTIERIKIQMSYETIKTQFDNELISIQGGKKYTFCFILDEDCEITRKNIANIKKSHYILTSNNWMEICNIKYQYLVILHYECQINPLFFNIFPHIKTGVILKTRYKRGTIYPTSIGDVLTKTKKNNIIAPKHDVDHFVKFDINKKSSQYLDTDIYTFDDFYYELLDKYISSKNISTTENVVIDVL